MRSAHKGQVGRWIEARLADLEMSGTDLAALVGVRPATIYNATSGRTAITLRDRARYEDALRWRRGSLTEAYRDGIRPEAAGTEPTTRTLTSSELLDRLRLRNPEEYKSVLTTLRRLDAAHPVEDPPPSEHRRDAG